LLASQPVWTRWGREEILSLPQPGIEPGRSARLVTVLTELLGLREV